MPRTRKTSKSHTRQAKTRRHSLKKAEPPPDNPLLRAEADRLAHGGGADVKEMARARAKALQKKE
jgi:hypothetical protein